MNGSDVTASSCRGSSVTEGVIISVDTLAERRFTPFSRWLLNGNAAS
jgi:hypothetical protein